MNLRNLLRPTNTKRLLFFLFGDILFIALSFYFAFYIRFELTFPRKYILTFLFWLPVILIIKLALLGLIKLYRVSWRFISLKELSNIIKALLFSTAIFFVLNYIVLGIWPGIFVPRGVILIDSMLSLVFLGGFRISKRIYFEGIRGVKTGKRTIIIGAGKTGERLVRELLRAEELGLYPVAFVDDNPHIKGTRIHGIPVLDNCKGMLRILKEDRIEAAIIAFPRATHRKVRKIFNLLSDAGIKEIKVAPSISRFPGEAISVRDIKDIRIEDLLSREAVKIALSRIKGFVENRTILVTGAGGSIGSEIVRQLLRFNPKKIIAYEVDETEVYNLSLSLNNDMVIPCIGDIREMDKLREVFRTFKPEVVFHSAAYKHVPLMEHFPEEAVKTNIFSTYNLAKLSLEYGVGGFVNISTDKAVNPTSVMGATKRMGELICFALNQAGKTRFVSVRFGNVLGSRGSVIPIFLEQIKNGRSVTVTHPEMERYFMTIPEAVLLVFQAASMGNGGEVFALDMGEPVKIVKLAEDLIRLHGLEPYEDVEIVFTGPRPGEKLFEELLTAEEGTAMTSHKKIFIARTSLNYDIDKIESILDELSNTFSEPEEIKRTLKRHISFYKEEKINGA